jgi:hypothetical protein
MFQWLGQLAGAPVISGQLTKSGQLTIAQCPDIAWINQSNWQDLIVNQAWGLIDAWSNVN